jgi:hypothetical protein
MMVRLAEAALYTSLAPPGVERGASEDKVSWCDLMRARRTSTSDALTRWDFAWLVQTTGFAKCGSATEAENGQG